MSVAAFLAAEDLAKSELAKLFDSAVIRSSWAGLANTATRMLAPWSWSCLLPNNPVTIQGPISELQASDIILQMHSPKMFLKQIAELQSSFSTVPSSWAPFVVATSRQALQASPTSYLWHRDQIEHLEVPECASIPLCLGTSKGKPLVVGVHVASKDGDIHESCLLGVDIPGLVGYFSFTFAPMSGRCFMHLPREEASLVAAVLPHLETTIEEEEPVRCPHSVQAWLRVESDGSISFYRQVQGGRVEHTGFMPNTALPKWAAEYHAVVHFHTSFMSSQTTADIIHVGQEVPPSLAQCSYSELAATWHVVQDS